MTMHWTLEYVIQSGGFLLLWLLLGGAVAFTVHRRDR
jgi:hypothetical protein